MSATFSCLNAPVLLVIGVVVVPHQLGRVRRIVRRFGGRGDQHRAEYAGAASRPPLRHLVDRLACVALDGRDVVDRQDREIDLQARLGTVRVVEVNRLQAQFLTGIDRPGDRLLQYFLLGLFLYLRATVAPQAFYESSTNGTKLRAATARRAATSGIRRAPPFPAAQDILVGAVRRGQGQVDGRHPGAVLAVAAAERPFLNTAVM